MILDRFSWSKKKNEGTAEKNPAASAGNGEDDLFNIFGDESMEPVYAEETPPDAKSDEITEEASEFTNSVEEVFRTDAFVDPAFAVDIIDLFNTDFSDAQKSALARATSRREVFSLLPPTYAPNVLYTGAPVEGTAGRIRELRGHIRNALITVIERKNNTGSLAIDFQEPLYKILVARVR